jgi:tricorn protease
LMDLGPLIGKRTWGGVIGIAPRHHLVDSSYTTQPEYANWFKDVGWDIENYGTNPDIEVDIAPQDYAHKSDPQLQRAITEAMRLIEEYPTLEPRPGERPKRGR